MNFSNVLYILDKLFTIAALLEACKWTAFWVVTFFLPPILLGIIRKTKARLQGRIGASIVQPLLDLIKMLRKGETLSVVASWIFRSTSAINFAVVLLIAILTPWISFKPTVLEHLNFSQNDQASGRSVSERSGKSSDSVGQGAHANALPIKYMNINGMSVFSADSEESSATAKIADDKFFGHSTTGSDIFLVIYMFAIARLFTVLAALDAGSVFGGFGASREVTLALLVEPAIVLALASLGCVAQTSDLNAIFSWGAQAPIDGMPPLWIIAGIALFLASLVELSRMPVDDPTTHLELTMVHEAMILENSGRNLALVEYTHLLKMTILLGLSGQCFLHGLACFFSINHWLRDVLSLLILVILSVSVAVIESLSVKLRWTKVPEFIAYSVAMSLLCTFIAIGVRH